MKFKLLNWRFYFFFHFLVVEQFHQAAMNKQLIPLTSLCHSQNYHQIRQQINALLYWQEKRKYDCQKKLMHCNFIHVLFLKFIVTEL